MVVEKKDFKFLKESYWYDSYIQHSFNELSWRSGATYYDSILTARLSWNWWKSQMIDFDYILEAQALLNIEKKYNIWKLEKLKNDSIMENGFKQVNENWNIPKNTDMINRVKPFMEVQVFWAVWKNKSIKTIN